MITVGHCYYIIINHDNVYAGYNFIFMWAPPQYVTLWVFVFVCLLVIEKVWVRGYSTKFPRRKDCRGLKFCLHIKIGVNI